MSFGKFRFSGYALSICVVCVLTSLVSGAPTIDGEFEANTTSAHPSYYDPRNNTDTRLSSTAAAFTPKNGKEVILNDTDRILMEGGPISNSLTVEPTLSSKKEIVVSKNLMIPDKVGPMEKNVIMSTITRNHTDSVILYRKKGDLDSTSFNNTKPVIEIPVTTEAIATNEKLPTFTSSSIKTNITNASLNITSTPKNIGVDAIDVPMRKLNTSAVVKTISKKLPKPKPTATVGGEDIDQPIPASPTKSLSLGMPRKIDYIMPIAISIIALPILSTATYVLYKRGRDCWDKRHYRRMDFLIDGMYNE